MRSRAVVVRNPSAWTQHRETFSGEEFIDFGLCGIDPDQGCRPEQRASDWDVMRYVVVGAVVLGLASVVVAWLAGGL